MAMKTRSDCGVNGRNQDALSADFAMSVTWHTFLGLTLKIIEIRCRAILILQWIQAAWKPAVHLRCRINAKRYGGSERWVCSRPKCVPPLLPDPCRTALLQVWSKSNRR